MNQKVAGMEEKALVAAAPASRCAAGPDTPMVASSLSETYTCAPLA